MQSFGPKAYYHPADAAGGAPAGGDTMTDPGAAALEDAGTDAGQPADDYADLAGDERVQAYLEKQYGHIPAEHRSPEGYQALLGAGREAVTLRQQLQQLREHGGQHQQETKAEERAFHAQILQDLEGELGQTLKPEQRRFFGGMLDRAFKAMTGHFEATYFTPLRDAFIEQRLMAEQEKAQALPDYAKHADAIRQVVAQYGVPFDAAYKMVMYDKGAKGAGGSIVAAPSGAASGTSGNAHRPVVDGDRPSGASQSAGKMPKYKSKEGARSGAAAALRRAGISVSG